MKDFFGNELEIGDTVAFNPPVYKGLVKGIVVKFTPKMIKVSYAPHGKQTTTETAVGSSDVVKHIIK
jgi:hypothetical protein